MAIVAGLVCGVAALSAVLDAPLDAAITVPTLVFVVAVGGVSLGALGVGGYSEVRYRRWSRLTKSDVLILASVFLMQLAVEILFAWWVSGTTAWNLIRFLTVFLVSAAGGGGYSRWRVWPNKKYESEEGRIRPFVPSAAMLGAAGGVVVVGMTLATSAFLNNIAAPAVPSIPHVNRNPGPVVALGDSYSAGEGLAPYIAGTVTTGCHRSTRAYAEQLTTAEGWQLTDFKACSGAVIADIFQSRRDGKVDPQVTGPARPSVGLVMLTIDGNNALFSSVIVRCLAHPSCLVGSFPPSNVYDPGPVAPSRQGPPGPPNPPGPPAPLLLWAQQRILAIGDADHSLFLELKNAFPNARIVVVGYPHLFPDRTAPLFPPECFNILRRIDRQSRLVLSRLQDQLNDVIYEEAASAGLEYVSPQAMWEGHEPCGAHGPYTHSAIPYLSLKKISAGSGSFHPSPAGQKTFARLTACYLNAFPDRPNYGSIAVPTKYLASPGELELPLPPGSLRPLPGCG